MAIPPALPPETAGGEMVPADSLDCRRRDSSFSVAAFLGPARGQRGRYQRHEQLMMAGDGVAVRIRTAAAAAGSGGTLHYILQRTVVLNKVEVRGGNRAKRDAEIATDGDRFEKDFGQQDGRTPVKVNAARVHLLDAGAEEAEIMMRSEAESGAVGGAMHVGNVGADGGLNGNRTAELVR